MRISAVAYPTHVGTLAIFLCAVMATGCNGKATSEESSQNAGPTAFTAADLPPVDLTTTLFADSFENSDDCLNQIKNWTTLILNDTCNKSTVPLQGLKYGEYNFGDEAVGPAADGHRALYFFGSSGTGYSGYQLKDLLLVSPPFPLAGLSSIQVSFSYLTQGLNSPGNPEFLKLEFCNGTSDDCGLGASPDPAALSGDRWTQLFVQDPSKNGVWTAASETLNLSGLDKTKSVYFRFRARLDQGLAHGAHFTSGANCCTVPTGPLSFLETAAIDKVSIMGTKTTDGGGGEGPPSDNPPPS